jgi:hypothetical protein
LEELATLERWYTGNGIVGSKLEKKELSSSSRRGARVVELATLERWYTGNGIVGSNPTLSAMDPFRS